ncbi:hypothetical protein RIF29_11963 [Crotalaria pallida]|uniref:ZF-HD dimerization-type domain-containing protein n=1 Tax=Crotalaria pallida TaxID=3830 RepID=A0AAN9IMN9_CROPI
MERDMGFAEQVNQVEKKPMGIQEPPPAQVHDSLPNSAAKSVKTSATAEKGEKSSAAAAAAAPPPPRPAGPIIRFHECQKNHATGLGAYTVDGCGEFMAGGPEGTLEATLCAACSCHRNFHRKEVDGVDMGPYLPQLWNQPPPPPQHHHQPQFPPCYHHPAPPPPPPPAAAGYLHHHHHIAAPPVSQHPPLALPVASGGGNSRDEEDISNPASNGGGGAGGGRGGGRTNKKRFRTKFTKEQKEQMLVFAEKVGWKIKKQDDDVVEQFCEENLVKKSVLKVWMHNNKNTLGKRLHTTN